MPHPQSRTSLLALQAQLRNDALRAQRVAELLPLKREFARLMQMHKKRYEHILKT